MQEVINLAKNSGGFWHSFPVAKKLIDFTIPFLPLERSHIKKCAKADLEEKGHPFTDAILNEVADHVSYFPKDQKAFSRSGCKKISSIVDYVMG